MNQYIVQNYNQIIDLFDQMDDTKNISIKISSESPFEITFLSREQLDNVDFATLSMNTSSHIQKVINASQRYAIIKSQQQTVVTVERTVTTQIAEMFPGGTTGVFLVIFIIVVICVVVGIVIYIKRKKVKALLTWSPVETQVSVFKRSLTKVGAMIGGKDKAQLAIGDKK